VTRLLRRIVDVADPLDLAVVLVENRPQVRKLRVPIRLCVGLQLHDVDKQVASDKGHDVIVTPLVFEQVVERLPFPAAL
jgi:hypothetical protein